MVACCLGGGKPGIKAAIGHFLTPDGPASARLQALARVTPLRDFFLLPANYAGCSSPLVQRFGELLRKAWNTRNFKGQARPLPACFPPARSLPCRVLVSVRLLC